MTMNDKAKRRIKHRSRSGKPPQNLITLLLTLGWCGMGIGSVIMIWGVFELNNYITGLITSGLWFFVIGILLLLIGSVLNRLRHLERTAKPALKPVPKHLRRRRRTPNAEHENDATP